MKGIVIAFHQGENSSIEKKSVKITWINFSHLFPTKKSKYTIKLLLSFLKCVFYSPNILTSHSSSTPESSKTFF